MINSRKLDIKAVVMLEVRVESLYDAEAAVDVKTDDGRVEIQRRDIDVAAIAVRRRIPTGFGRSCPCQPTSRIWRRFCGEK